jgi:hypothetical protein
MRPLIFDVRNYQDINPPLVNIVNVGRIITEQIADTHSDRIILYIWVLDLGSAGARYGLYINNLPE